MSIKHGEYWAVKDDVGLFHGTISFTRSEAIDRDIEGSKYLVEDGDMKRKNVWNRLRLAKGHKCVRVTISWREA